MKQIFLALCLFFTSQAMAFTKIVSSGDMSASITSSTVTLSGKKGFAIHAVYTGSPVGTLTLEASNNGSNWETITGTSTAVSGASSTLFNASDVQYELVRLKYTFSSGTGTLNVYASEKE